MRLPLIAPALFCIGAVALTGCGRSNLLDGSSADELQASLSQIQSASADGRCDEASKAVRQGLQRVNALPSSVDGELVARIREGFQELEAKVPEDCSPPTTTEETPTTTNEEPPPTTETTPSTTETTPSTTETTPSTTETTPSTTDTAPEPDTTTGEDDSGGVSPGDVDGPAATPRALRELEEAGREARKRIEQAMREAGRAIRGES